MSEEKKNWLDNGFVMFMYVWAVTVLGASVAIATTLVMMKLTVKFHEWLDM